MTGLTRKQAELLAFIGFFQKARGVCPSYAEMAEGVGLSPKSKAAIQWRLDDLEADGIIRRTPRRWRAIEIIAHPVTSTRRVA